MKNIIIDGIDCRGKSTLIKNFKFKLKKFGGYDVKELEHRDIDDQFRRYALEYIFNVQTIFDRSHISELVFGKILRNKIPFSSTHIKILDQIVRTEFITVLATPSYEDFCIRYNDTRKYQVISCCDFNDITNEFIENSINIKPILYKSSCYNELDELVDKIITILTNGE